jgi:hypothetical protein
MSTKDSQIRATAYRHAQSFEEKKAIRNRVADLVVELFDIPAGANAEPGCPQQSDAALFKQGLSLFQPSDFDDLVRERNIDNRCGYGLCPKPNVKIQGGHTVWNGRGGKNFNLVPKEELERWCSEECGNRATFVRGQLSKEPAWNRETSNVDIRLLDDVQRAHAKSNQEAYEKSNQEAAEANKLTGSLESMSLDNGRSLTKDELADRLQDLALERGELKVKDSGDQVSLLERWNTAIPEPPVLVKDEDMIEGHQPRRVRFANDDGVSSDEEMLEADGMHDDPDI